MDFSKINEDLIPNILSNIHLKTIKKLTKSSKTMRKNIKNNHMLWNSLAQSDDFNIKNNVEIVKNSYLIQKNIKRGQNEHIITFNTKQKDITDLQVTAQEIICSSDDSTVKVFSYNGREKKVFVGHRGGVWTFALTDTTMITGSTDKTGRVWDMNTASTLCILQGHTSTIRVVKTHSGYICTGGRDSVVRVWKMNGELLHVLIGHTESVRCLDMNDKYLVSGSYDGSVVLWNYKTGEKLFNMKKHKKRVYAVILGQKYVASSGLDAEVHISDLDGRVVCSHKAHTSLVAWLSFTNKEKYILSSGADHTICKWDIEEFKVVYIIEESTPIAAHAVVNNLLIVATQKEVKVYDYLHGVFIRKLMEAEKVYKMKVMENCIIVGFFSYGEYQIRIYKY
ncbi:F-box/WD repeat-containing protein 7 [Nosema granulosis]|uniref:F-box/WD repeat-containing protein 7 n=1 Tax=Nosema granulosis TaxID=83296 RepID=A0A9P6GZS2_9MICR|nr:F-box/WD repeat-containing protein 7 [Nosema granulosis]